MIYHNIVIVLFDHVFKIIMVFNVGSRQIILKSQSDHILKAKVIDLLINFFFNQFHFLRKEKKLKIVSSKGTSQMEILQLHPVNLEK